MAKKPSKSTTVMLDGVRGKWFTLDKPDTTYNKEGSYGVGVLLDAPNAAKISAAVAEIGEAAGVPYGKWEAGDVLKVNMRASGENRKTGEIWHDTPGVFNPDMSPATPDEIAKLGRKSRIRINVNVKSYEGVGNNPDGVSTKLIGVQIIAYDGGELSAEELGFTPVAETSDTDAF